MKRPDLSPIEQVDRTWKPPHYTSLERRLWLRVGITPSGCWEWIGSTSRGYGRIRDEDGKGWPVHRLVYTRLVGPVQEPLQLDHLCRNRACCNPEHLEPVTPRVNTLRGESLQAQNAVKTHCPKGHPYEGDNLLVRVNKTHRNGHRCCRACGRLRRQRQRRERTP